MRIVIISDTHNKLSQISIPEGDLLIHCGDFCGHGTIDEVARFSEQLAELPHRHKVVIAGNHDWPFERQNAAARAALENVVYLEDSGVSIDGLKIYGSPWQPEFMNWAFNLPRQSRELEDKWRCIPDGTDILVTHGPPYRILDATRFGQHAGCELLRRRVEEIKPRVHCFGHIHEAYGQEKRDGTLFVNASVLNLWYRPQNKPVVVDLD
ncbi:MAG TPA: metallophosphatase domain-containing protein [Candidatus Obscuribacterales bacterium]